MSINSQMKKAFFIDLDGTLIDNFVAIHKGFVYVANKLNLQVPSLSEVKSAVGGSARISIQKLFGKEYEEEGILLYDDIFPSVIYDGMFVNEGVQEFLKWAKLNDYTLAVLTNKNEEFAQKLVEKAGLKLDYVIGTKKYDSFRKPQKEYVDYAMDRIGITNCAMIGDSIYDAQTAINANIDSYILSTGTHSFKQLSKELPASSKLFHSFFELKAYFENGQK